MAKVARFWIFLFKSVIKYKKGVKSIRNLKTEPKVSQNYNCQFKSIKVTIFDAKGMSKVSKNSKGGQE